jgi:hypothetical protein
MRYNEKPHLVREPIMTVVKLCPSLECDLGVVPVSLDNLPKCSLTHEQTRLLSEGTLKRVETPLFLELKENYLRNFENAVRTPFEPSR